MTRTLFDPDPAPPPVHLVPATANADPDTSKAAERRHTRSEERKNNAKTVLALVRAYPGSTGHELWAAATEDKQKELGSHHEVYRRLADLESLGLVKQGPARACHVRGRAMVTRWPAGE